MSVFIGATIAFYIKTISEKNTKLLISFSGAYLFSITVLHLIPEAFAGEHNHSIAIFILIGFFIQILLEHFSQGVEHGHGHVHGSLSLSMLIGLCIHSFIEGMPLGNPFTIQYSWLITLSYCSSQNSCWNCPHAHALDSKLSKLKP